MTKFYYDCPIIAAYMRKHFDVQISNDLVLNEQLIKLAKGEKLSNTTYPVRPSSYEIFRINLENGITIVEFDGKFFDVFEDNGGAVYGVEHKIDREKNSRFIEDHEKTRIIKNRAKIIEVDKKQFFMPKF